MTIEWTPFDGTHKCTCKYFIFGHYILYITSMVQDTGWMMMEKELPIGGTPHANILFDYYVLYVTLCSTAPCYNTKTKTAP